MNTSESIPFSWLLWQRNPSQSCCHTPLLIPQHTSPEYMGAICVHAGCWCTVPSCRRVVSMSQCAHSRTPTPSSEKPHVASRETPTKDGTTQRKMHHQNECREKWENGEGIQSKLSCSIHQEGGKHFLSHGHSTSCGHWHPRVCPQHSCSVTNQWKPLILFTLTSELLPTHWECSETGIREHSSKVPSMVCFYEH